MTATVTLATTTLAQGCNGSETRIKLTSTAGVGKGTHLYVGGDLMRAILVDVDSWVIVARGQGGSKASPHVSGDTVYVGRADQFYCCPPSGRPEAAVLVSPYIDVVAANLYFAQGDTTPSATANRWWQIQTNTRTAGALGVQTTTLDPTSST